MGATAFQTQYRKSFVAGFERRASLLRKAVTTEVTIKGKVATFLVADSGAASAVTRGVNGMVPARENNLTPNACQLQEWHDLVQRTDFNVFASQGNAAEIMQLTTMGVINRKIDADIISELDKTILNAGAARSASPSYVQYVRVVLQNQQVGWADEDHDATEDNLCFVITPAFAGYLQQFTTFSNADFGTKGMRDAVASGFFVWNGFSWIVHSGLPGVGTASESCFAFHRKAIGHAVDADRIDAPVGYMEEQGYSFARASAFMGSRLLQSTGVVRVRHDASQYVAS